EPPPQPRPQQPPPPPPPPPPPQPKEMPPITPDMTLKDGARPDGSPKPSQGNTQELKTGSASNPEPPKTAGRPKPEPKSEPPQQIAQNTNPNALSLRDLAGKILQQQSQEPKHFPGNGNQGPRTGIPAPNIPENPDFSTEEPKILSPTYGYDFGPYLNQVLNKIRYSWYALIPEIAKFRKGRVVIIFRIQKDGTVWNPHIVANSGTDPLDRAAFGSITGSNPFPPLPNNFEGGYLDLQITYLYNINP